MISHPPSTEVQQVLDAMWTEELLPFKLNVGKLEVEEGGYTIHFHDSRIHTAQVSWKEGESVNDSIRAAVLDRVRRMSGPLGVKPR